MLTLQDERYNDVRLIFKEEGHSYTDTLNNSYLSTTTFLHEYQPAFDKKFWLKKGAKDQKISERELEDRWEKIKDEACARGNATHNKLEDGVKEVSKFKQAVRSLGNNNFGDSMITIADLPNIHSGVKELDIQSFIDFTENKYPKLYNVFNSYTQNGYKIYAEIGSFLIDYLLSGTIDILCVRDDKFVIGDYKTNRGGLKFTSGYYKKDKTSKPYQDTNEWVAKNDRLLPPINNLPSCNGAIYNMQLSIYAKYVEMILGIPCAGLWLCHIDSDFELNDYGMPRRYEDGSFKVKKNPKENVTIHVMNYKEQEVMRLLEDRKSIVNATRKSQFKLNL